MFLDFSDYFIRHVMQGTFDEEANARMAAGLAQKGKCYITGRPLEPGYRHLHHCRPRDYGGGDEPLNLIYVGSRVHRLIHATYHGEISSLIAELNLTPEQMRLINKLRAQAFREPVEIVHTVAAGVAA